MNTPSDSSKFLILLTKGHYTHDYERDELMQRAVGYICDLEEPASTVATIGFMMDALKEAAGAERAYKHVEEIVRRIEDPVKRSLEISFDNWIHGLYAKLQGLQVRRFPRGEEKILIDLSLEKKPIDHPAIKLKV